MIVERKKLDCSDSPHVYQFEERTLCPVCGTSGGESLYAEPFASGDTFRFINDYYKGRIFKEQLARGTYELIRCDACTLIYQKYILDRDGLEHLYEHAISPSESLRKRTEAPHQYFMKLIKSAAAPATLMPKKLPRDIEVLDFGMGWGHWVFAARAHGYTVKGAEISAARVSYAQKGGVEIIDPLDDDWSESFDFVNTDQVFEHLDRPDKFLNALQACLRPGGVIKIFVPDSEPDYRAIMAGNWRPRKDAFHPLEHINAFNWQSMLVLTRKYGLHSVDDRLIRRGFRRYYHRLRRRTPSWYFSRQS